MLLFKCLLLVSFAAAAVNSKSIYKGLRASIKDASGSREVVINDVQDLAEAYEVRIEDQRLPTLSRDLLKGLTRLDTLVIRNCGLETVEADAFVDPGSLRILDLSRNNLKSLSPTAFNGLHLWRVNLTENYLTALGDKTFDDMPKLRVVELDTNRLTRINPNWFNGSPKVFRLSANNNRLTEIPRAAFKNMDRDAALDIWLMENQIKEIHSEAFDGVKNIESLWLSKNKIRKLSPKMFQDVDNISSFYIDRNQLECVDDSTLRKLKVDAFNIDSNPMGCECLGGIRKWAKAEKVELHSATLALGCLRERIEDLFDKQKSYYEDQIDRLERKEEILK